MLIKAKPIIDAIENVIKSINSKFPALLKQASLSSFPIPNSKFPALLKQASLSSFPIPNSKFPVHSAHFQILFPSPSKTFFTQKFAHKFSKNQNLIFICWRYEGIDYRFEEYVKNKYPKNFQKISIWQFITLGWELPTMTMIESITRLIPWVIKESQSRKDESYSIDQKMKNLEYPQYTRPEEVCWYKVPETLLNWHHKKIQDRKNKNGKKIER
jgi:tRNA (guanine-N1)-methyltransferase